MRDLGRVWACPSWESESGAYPNFDSRVCLPRHWDRLAKGLDYYSRSSRSGCLDGVCTAKSREGALNANLRSVSGQMLLGYFLLHQVVSACKCCSGVDGQYLPVKKDAVLVRSIKRE